MAEVNTESRKPTREQRRAIADLLNEVYDTEAGRYKGAETDQTVATAIGPEILWGWVTQIREDMYGPDGNEEAILNLKELQEVHAQIVSDVKDAMAKVATVNALIEQLERCRYQVEKLIEKLERKK